jgi:membrane fusion protein (multidrug efflux system)
MKVNNLIALVVLSACAPKTPQPTAQIQSLPVVQVSSGEATTYQEYPASIEGAINIEIRPQVSGTLDHVFVDEGAYVKAGEALFKINAASYRERLNNARARLYAVEGALSNAQIEIEKLTPLVEHQVIADYQLKTAQAAKQIAQGNVEQAKADIAAAEINLGYTLIKAPVSGFIGRILRKQGSLVSPEDPTSLTNLSDVHNVHVYFALGETDFILFKTKYPGKTLAEKLKQVPDVELIMPDDSSYSLKGRIDMIDGQFDRTTGAITVRATFKNEDGLLRSGNTSKLRLALKIDNTVTIPQAATVELQDKIFVFLVGDSNRIVKQPIIIAGRSGTNYLVKEGLKAGDHIVFDGLDHVHEGEIIQPQPLSPDSVNQVVHN